MSSFQNDQSGSNGAGEAGVSQGGGSTSSPIPDGLPSVSIPSGGGTIRSMGESFAMSQATGTGTFTIPLHVSKGRTGAEVSLSLDYSTGNGNGVFGMGWTHSFDMSVTRKTNPRLPRYIDNDHDQRDIFVLSDQDELVPIYQNGADGKLHPDTFEQDDFHVERFRPRIDEQYTRIELWSNNNVPGDTHWRAISTQNVTSIFGLDEDSRIYAKGIGGPVHPRIFTWLLCERFDDRGNFQSFVYKREDSVNVDTSLASEAHRSTEARARMRYLKRIRYGNRDPVTTRAFDRNDPRQWLFEIVYDYGDHILSNPTAEEGQDWPCRKDAFSTYRSGFELRTYRLCRRVLMFHHFREELGILDYLVSATELKYEESDSITYLQSVQHVGYMLVSKDPQSFGAPKSLSQALPPITLEYTQPLSRDQITSQSPRALSDAESLMNVPSGVSESYQWIDLLGEGIPGIFSQQAGEWFYKQNLGPLSIKYTEDSTSQLAGRQSIGSDAVRLGPVQSIPIRPSLRPEQVSALKFVDVASDGIIDMVYQDQQLNGFYKSAASMDTGEPLRAGWRTFQPFVSAPTIDLTSSNARYLDLSGDGLADIVVLDRDLFVWYESLGEQGYGSASAMNVEWGDNLSPRMLFSDQSESIFLADMSGDGLIDIVRIRNSDVCYWPNMGYGYFGSMITMDNAPVFDDDTDFSLRNVTVCDVDGSGTSDLVYQSGQQAQLYLNSSGNAFQSAISITLPVSWSENVTIAAVDLFGNNTTCLVWSVGMPSITGSPSVFYSDLNNGLKPHLLCKVSNSMGAETEIQYAPSTLFYLKDKAAGKPWLTRLPYPVHCVEQVLKRDLITNSTYIQRYAYHHGAYDPVLREFAGFAMVEQWDTEILGLHNLHEAASNWTEAFNLPPIHTKNWFHTGVLSTFDSISAMLADEYFRFRNLEKDNFSESVSDGLANNLLSGDHILSLAEQEQANRALRGQPLREEVYTDDQTDMRLIPHSITIFGNDISLLQPALSLLKKAVFRKHVREAINITCERLKDQMRIEHSIVLDTDGFGNVLKDIQINYGRKKPDPKLTAIDQDIQARTVIVYEENTFTSPVTERLAYRRPMPYSTKRFEVTGLRSSDSGSLFKPSDFVSLLQPSEASSMPKKLLSQTEIRYRRDDLTGLIIGPHLGSLALDGATFNLALLPNTFDDVRAPWRPTSDTSSTSAISASDKPFENAILIKDGGYIDLFNDGRVWTQTTRGYYHPTVDIAPSAELEAARTSFFTTRRLVDAYGSITLVDHDRYSLLPIRVEDTVHNITTGEIDYRVLQPDLVTDENGNRTAALYDALGNVSASASMGKITEEIGDSIEGLSPVIDQSDLDSFFRDPMAIGPRLLGKASSRHIEDYLHFSRNQQACRSADVHREIHNHEKPTSPVTVELRYTSGLGKVIQQKQNAEPENSNSKSSRWRCSQYVVLNNKGLPVEEFEPFFDNSPDLKLEHKSGLSTLHLYDSLNRNVIDIFPNKAWSKTIYSPWVSVYWDTNDTVMIDALQDDYAKIFIKPILAPRCTPTWYEARVDGNLGQFEKLAADKTKLHAGTPTSEHLDSMGRIFLTNSALSANNSLTRRTKLNVLGQVEQVQDQDGRIVITNTLDMLGRVVCVRALDTGQKWTLIGSGGEVMLHIDERGYQLRSEYDGLGRPTRKWCQNRSTSITEYLMTETQYGEGVPRAEINNLRKKVYQHSDQSGLRRTAVWDFKGRSLLQDRRIAKNYSSVIDWQQRSTVGFETIRFVTATRYDALGRVTSVIGADDTILQHQFLPGGLFGSTIINTRNEKGQNGKLIWRSIVGQKSYDALGRMTEETQGNGVRTTMSYDPETRQLLQQRSVRNGVVVQDNRYTRDPMHNPVYVQRSSTLSSNSRFAGTSADSGYTYDPLYRLIESTGRENVAQTKGLPDMPGSEPVSTNFAVNDKSAMKRFKETYTYDDYGNMTALAHEIGDPQIPGWTRRMTYGQQTVDGQNFVGNRLSSSVVSRNTTTYQYDSQGNPTSMPHLSKISWDYSSQLRSSATQITNSGTPDTTWYVYDSDGVRIRKVTERFDNSNSTPRKLSDHIYVDRYDTYEEYAGDGQVTKKCETHRIVGDDEICAVVEFWSGSANRSPPRLFRFQVNDATHLTGVELDVNGQEITHEEYSAFGSTMYTMQTGEAPRQFRYSMKRRDKENGFYYFGRRFYVSWFCRFLNPDPAGIVDGTNTYECCASNPIVWRDPDGLTKIRQFGRLNTHTYMNRRRVIPTQQFRVTPSPRQIWRQPEVQREITLPSYMPPYSFVPTAPVKTWQQSVHESMKDTREKYEQVQKHPAYKKGKEEFDNELESVKDEQRGVFVEETLKPAMRSGADILEKTLSEEYGAIVIPPLRMAIELTPWDKVMKSGEEKVVKQAEKGFGKLWMKFEDYFKEAGGKKDEDKPSKK